LDRERISVLGEISLETTVIIDVKCPSVKRDRLFILLLFMIEKDCSDEKDLPNSATILNPKDLGTWNFSFGK
jgi:hypothetical protein